MNISFRPLSLETDAPRYVELLSTFYSDPVTVDQLREWESQFPKDAIRHRELAIDARGEIVGRHQCWHTPHMLPTSYWVEVIVFPEYQHHGVGSQLFDRAQAFAYAQRATRLELEVRDHTPNTLQFAQKRGFEIDRHIFESTLDLATFDESRFAGEIEGVSQAGIRFFNFADVGDTAENRLKLYELNKRTALDIPGSEGTFPRFEDFEKYVFESSWFRPEGQIFAADGDKWIGMSAVGYYKATNSMYTMHTGVLAEYRGRGIALALKLLSIRFGRVCGAVFMRTNNDSKNAPILAINQRLGYQPQPGWYRLLKKL